MYTHTCMYGYIIYVYIYIYREREREIHELKPRRALVPHRREVHDQVGGDKLLRSRSRSLRRYTQLYLCELYIYIYIHTYPYITYIYIYIYIYMGGPSCARAVALSGRDPRVSRPRAPVFHIIIG